MVLAGMFGGVARSFIEGIFVEIEGGASTKIG